MLTFFIIKNPHLIYCAYKKATYILTVIELKINNLQTT